MAGRQRDALDDREPQRIRPRGAADGTSRTRRNAVLRPLSWGGGEAGTPRWTSRLELLDRGKRVWGHSSDSRTAFGKRQRAHEENGGAFVQAAGKLFARMESRAAATCGNTVHQSADICAGRH